MPGLPDIQENNEQILNDIQSLQEIEQQLFNNLETNTNLTPQQQQKLIEKMNQISNMRINLYKTLSGVNNFFQNALESSVGTLKEQATAIAIVESELNQSKKRLELLEAEKNNKIRLVEINNYYGDKYEEHSQLMKIVIFTLIPVIIFAFLNNKGILPNSIYYVLIGIVSLVGAIFFWRRFTSIITRDNMNYQEYNWYFDPNAAPTGSSNSTDPWASAINTKLGTCVGEYCCSEGQIYDASLNQCTTSTNTSTSTTSTTTESFLTESMVNNVLTKTQQGKFKTDYNLADYQAPLSKSFINYSKK
jgi:hypothetical protein